MKAFHPKSVTNPSVKVPTANVMTPVAHQSRCGPLRRSRHRWSTVHAKTRAMMVVASGT